MRGPDDHHPDVLAHVVHARLRQDTATAAEIAAIAFTPPEHIPERWPAMSVIAAVCAHDRYHCRHCGERVILTAVMRPVSRLYPDQFPYHRNWKADATHPAFIARPATLDHVHPHRARRDPLAIDDPHSTWAGLTDLFRPLWEAVGRPTLSADEAAWMRAVSHVEPAP